MMMHAILRRLGSGNVGALDRGRCPVARSSPPLLLGLLKYISQGPCDSWLRFGVIVERTVVTPLHLLNTLPCVLWFLSLVRSPCLLGVLSCRFVVSAAMMLLLPT